VFKKLYEELMDFSQGLKLYLLLFVENPLLKMANDGIIKTHEVFKGFDEVISFNYTSTYEFLYGDLTVHHIHGKLDRKIILGINPDENDELPNFDKQSELQLETNYIMFKKYYQRVYYRTDNDLIKVLSLINEERRGLHPERNILIVCGHSLDVTDKDIIKDSFAVSDYIIVVCHKLSSIGNYVKNLIKIYGKTEFDRLRSEKNLEFITYDEWEEFPKIEKILENYNVNQ
jgi:hypothetical protein